MRRPDLLSTATLCDDPAAPNAAQGGADSANVLTNPNFSNGMTGWGIDGPLVHNSAANRVFEMYAQASNPANGVLLQNTGITGTAAGRVFEASFRLGNTTPARIRVVAVVSSSDFNDLMSCGFWVAPGTPLTTFILRGWTTQAATAPLVLSFYPTPRVSIDPSGRALVDNVSMRFRPSLTTIGTECYPPGTAPSDVLAMEVEGDAVPMEPGALPTLIPTATPQIVPPEIVPIEPTPFDLMPPTLLPAGEMPEGVTPDESKS